MIHYISLGTRPHVLDIHVHVTYYNLWRQNVAYYYVWVRDQDLGKMEIDKEAAVKQRVVPVLRDDVYAEIELG